MKRFPPSAVAGAVLVFGLLVPGSAFSSAADREAAGGWALVHEDGADRAEFRMAQEETFGGVCVLGQRNRVTGDTYPKNIYFAGGARCTSGGQPVDVFQEGRVTLYKSVRESYLAEGNEIFGLQDWSVSKGNYSGGSQDLRFTNNLDLRLTTPDGKPCAIVPKE